MAKHTQGPWRVAIGSRLEIRGPRDEIGWPVPVVYNAGLHTDETAQANARLIAAAPELLAALQSIAETFTWAKNHGGKGYQYAVEDLGDIVAAAIAKATD
jgi:hypothetical protein